MSAGWQNIQNHNITKWLLYITIIFILLLLLFFLANVAIAAIYENKFLPGTSLAGVDISGLSLEQAKERIDKRVDFVSRRGFVYNSDLKKVVIYPTLTAVESTDSSYDLVNWQVEETLQNLLAWQQGKNPEALWRKLNILTTGEDFSLNYYWQRGRHRQILEENFTDVLTPRQEASFSLTNGTLRVVSEKAGQVLDYQKALEATKQQIEELTNDDIKLEIIADQPQITTSVIQSQAKQLEGLAQRGPLNLTLDDEQWAVTDEDWLQWLIVKKTETNIALSFSEKAISAYLEANDLKNLIELPVRDAKFQLSESRVTEFISSQEGRALDWPQTISRLEAFLADLNASSIELAVSQVEPQVKNQDVNSLGIVELLGTGASDFKGSPPNRIHNIGVGAKSLNGVLISPGQEFSLLQALGEIDGEHGYKEELVIKGNRTIPEFGGGLCQIGTTVFRGALASGLPITERRNHSYRVRYYEPAGTDATIYNPWPDFKFVNDTGKHILIQTRIEGTKLYFDYWGTSDGRIARSTEPEIYNIVAPPPKKIIKTTDLPVGKEKCTEAAHSGADAKFTYAVQYAGEAEPREQIFYSHYVPWQEVCLLGVTPEELLAEQASSTDSGL